MLGHTAMRLARATGAGTIVFLSACRESRKAEETYSAPPAAVVASFQHFADSVAPQLFRLLDSVGLHAGWSDTASRGSHLHLHVQQQTDRESRAKLYEADLSLTLHQHLSGPSGFPMPMNVFLEFASIGRAKKWALLTDEGYPFAPVTDTRRNDLPLDIQVAVRAVFRTRIEFSDWMAYRRAELEKGVVADSGN